VGPTSLSQIILIMNDRKRAIDILQQARELLAGRLTERVLDAGQEILDDAAGLTYLSEIGTIYDELGARLTHVNQLLAALPAEDESPAAPAAVHYVDGYRDLDHWTRSATMHADDAVAPPNEPHSSDTLALPAPPGAAPSQLPSPASWRKLTGQVDRCEFAAAEQTLVELLQLKRARARQCLAVFMAAQAHDASAAQRLTGLAEQVRSGRIHEALDLLRECFGLQGVESLLAVQSMRQHASPEN